MPCTPTPQMCHHAPIRLTPPPLMHPALMCHSHIDMPPHPYLGNTAANELKFIFMEVFLRTRNGDFVCTFESKLAFSSVVRLRHDHLYMCTCTCAVEAGSLFIMQLCEALMIPGFTGGKTATRLYGATQPGNKHCLLP